VGTGFSRVWVVFRGCLTIKRVTLELYGWVWGAGAVYLYRLEGVEPGLDRWLVVGGCFAAGAAVVVVLLAWSRRRIVSIELTPP